MASVITREPHLITGAVVCGLYGYVRSTPWLYAASLFMTARAFLKEPTEFRERGYEFPLQRPIAVRYHLVGSAAACVAYAYFRSVPQLYVVSALLVGSATACAAYAYRRSVPQLYAVSALFMAKAVWNFSRS